MVVNEIENIGCKTTLVITCAAFTLGSLAKIMFVFSAYATFAVYLYNFA
jgi:hypothetical protein